MPGVWADEEEEAGGERQPVDWLLGWLVAWPLLADAAWRQLDGRVSSFLGVVAAKSKTFRVDCSNTAEVKH